jgi:hypothetical protein
MKGLIPDYNTISNFRRDKPMAIKKVFRATVSLAKYNLTGGISWLENTFEYNQNTVNEH